MQNILYIGDGHEFGNTKMTSAVALIGFGEAASGFATPAKWAACAYDVKTDDLQLRTAKLADYAKAGVDGATTLAESLAEQTAILSLVTADQAVMAATEAAKYIENGAHYFDMNSIAPDTKRAAAAAITAAGGCYVDVAVMAPVYPAQLAVPLLLSGPCAESGATLLAVLGFTKLRVVAGDVGRASAIKMIRSVMVKGTEALTAEMMLAAHKAGVVEDVLESLGPEWHDKANYNLDRMMVHGVRRAAEMEEAVKTLRALDVDPVMTIGTVARQRSIGRLKITPLPDTLASKLKALA
jgi:3-hydroxyisobutyrate dehydrogenase-like beta-hydroxyacid dehydrogenase